MVENSPQFTWGTPRDPVRPGRGGQRQRQAGVGGRHRHRPVERDPRHLHRSRARGTRPTRASRSRRPGTSTSTATRTPAGLDPTPRDRRRHRDRAPARHRPDHAGLRRTDARVRQRRGRHDHLRPTFLGGQTRAYGSATPTPAAATFATSATVRRAPGRAAEHRLVGRDDRSSSTTCRRWSRSAPTARCGRHADARRPVGQQRLRRSTRAAASSARTTTSSTCSARTARPTAPTRSLTSTATTPTRGNTPEQHRGQLRRPAARRECATNDIFLLRSVPSSSARRRRVGAPGHRQLRRPISTPNADRLERRHLLRRRRFVAVLHAQPTPAPCSDRSDRRRSAQGDSRRHADQRRHHRRRLYGVERINYDSAINGGVHVYGLGGNDYFAVDDNAAPTTSTAARATTSFQIGQIYGDAPQPAPGRLAAGRRRRYNALRQRCAAENVFDVATVATTRGWLSRGTSAPLVAAGRHRRRHLHRLLEPGGRPARGRRRQRPVHRPRLRARPDRRRRQHHPARRLRRPIVGAVLPADPDH